MDQGKGAALLLALLACYALTTSAFKEQDFKVT
jgi:hypothetical protein